MERAAGKRVAMGVVRAAVDLEEERRGAPLLLGRMDDPTVERPAVRAVELPMFDLEAA